MSHLSKAQIGITTFLVSLLLAAHAAAAVKLVDWNLNTVTGPATNNTSFSGVPAATATLAATLSAGDLVTASSPGHAGLVWSSANSGSGQLNLQRWDHPNDNPSLTGNGNGNPNNWLQFSLAATSGYEFALASINLSAWRNGTGAPAAWSFQTSDDNGATWTPFGSVHTETNQGDSIYRAVNFTGSVSGSTLLIRFIATGPTGGTGNLHINSIILNGTVSQVISTPPVVTILPESTLVPAGQLITLRTNVEGSAIHYTLDNTVPGAGSMLYTDPFPLNSSATIRALAIHNTLGTGPVASQTFTLQQPIGTPNLLIIVADDVGLGDLQCYGNVNIATPALDSLAYDGIRFTQFTTTGPGSLASQYALLTGRVAARSQLGATVAAGTSGWQAEEWTLAEMLRRRGYSTAFIGEWQLGNTNGSYPNDQGFQLFHGIPYAITGNPPLEENRQVLETAPNPALLLGELTTRAKTFIAAANQPFALLFQTPALPATGTSIGGPHGNRVEALDSAVGQLLAALDAHGLAGNTLVVFLSDGGAERTASGGSNGVLRDGAGTTWEGGLRAPLIARLPGTLSAGQMNLSLIWLPDLMPTLASLLGGNLASDRPLDGTPRPAVLTGTQTRPAGDETAYGFRYKNNAWQLTTARQGKWKSHLSIVNIDPLNTNPTTGSQLYDLHVDAEEHINRASEQGAILTQLQSLATSFSASLPTPGTTDLPLPKPAIINGVSTTLDSNASAVRFEFSRPEDSLDENYHIEHSANLITWESLPITPYVVSPTTTANQQEKLKIRVPFGDPPLNGNQRFVRLSAQRPANP